MPYDYKKECKEFYQPSKKPSLVEVPAMNYVAVHGKGDPNEPDGDYPHALELLYGISFTIKMAPKAGVDLDGYFAYVVPPLEGFWSLPGSEGFDPARKAEFSWISCIRLPDFVTPETFAWAKEEAERPSLPASRKREGRVPTIKPMKSQVVTVLERQKAAEIPLANPKKPAHQPSTIGTNIFQYFGTAVLGRVSTSINGR